MMFGLSTLLSRLILVVHILFRIIKFGFFFQDLTNNISDTRTGVTDVKTFIDGMRSSRDTKMSDMTSLKTQLKDQNERMIKVTQDKARLEAKNKARQAKVRYFGDNFGDYFGNNVVGHNVRGLT